MLALSGPEADAFERARRHLLIGAVLAAVCWSAVAVVLVAPLSEPVQRYASGTAIVLGCLILAAVCFFRYSEGVGRRQVAWMLWTIAAVAAAFVYGWPTVFRPTTASGGVMPSDLATVIALGLALSGFVFFTSATRTGLGLARMLLDGVVLGGSVILIGLDLVQPRLFSDVGSGTLSALVAILQPVVDLVIVTVTALFFVRVGRNERPAMGLGCAGFCAFAISDLWSAMARAEGQFQIGSPMDLGTIAGFAVLSLGMAWPIGPLPLDAEEPTTRSAIRGTLITFGIFVAASVLHIVTADPARSWLSELLMVVVLLAVAARQVLLILDNERLRDSLEQRVRDRNIELREVTQRTDLLVDSVGDGVYGVDALGIVTFVNPAAALVLGYRPRELMGRNAHEAFHTTDGQVEIDPADCYVAQVIADGTATSSIEDTYRAKDGRHFPVEVTASPLAGDSRARGAVVVFRDVTQRREVDRLKREFVSMVSHELKTPLTAIRGSLGLLTGGAMGELAPPARRMVEIAMDSGERLTRLINQILDLERIESGVMALTLRRLRAGELVSAAVEQLEVLAAQHHVTITTVTTEGVVWADSDQVDQALVNLLGNAIKYSPPGGDIQVGAAMTGTLVEFWVSDHGRGIPEDQLEAVFTRFHQVDSSDAREKGGTGLGLAISRSIIERLGGAIWAENGPSGGATFRFTLPAASVQDTLQIAPPAQGEIHTEPREDIA